ncbi:MAG: ATPase domain-containing protein [Terracidiphilus sp.]
MPAAAALRLQIEHALERRFPAALTPAPRAVQETAPTGIAEVDELLGGGLPVGAISEVTGPESSGRTSLALAFLAQCTREGRACAWVDAEDAFDPESAAANGVALRQLLWVRCGNANEPAQGKPLKRSLTRSLTRPLTRPTTKPWTKPWTRLDQAVRAADLLLQGGGFAAIVLDLAGTAPEHARRIPLATWFRFRQAATRTRCSLLVLGQMALAQSSAAVVLECAPLRVQSSGGTVLNGFTFAVQRGRSAVVSTMGGARKLPASAWPAGCAWDAEKSA